MAHLEPDKRDIFFQFDHLHTALIDASSVIYMDKIDALEILASSIRLFSIQEILRETGPVSKGIEPINYHKLSSSNDQKLLSCALETGIALISEDKQILMAMKRAARPFFNTLMMLNFLLYRRRIQNQQYAHFHQSLAKIARYSEDIWKYGAAVNAAIKELI